MNLRFGDLTTSLYPALRTSKLLTVVGYQVSPHRTLRRIFQKIVDRSNRHPDLTGYLTKAHARAVGFQDFLLGVCGDPGGGPTADPWPWPFVGPL